VGKPFVSSAAFDLTRAFRIHSNLIRVAQQDVVKAAVRVSLSSYAQGADDGGTQRLSRRTSRVVLRLENVGFSMTLLRGPRSYPGRLVCF